MTTLTIEEMRATITHPHNIRCSCGHPAANHWGGLHAPHWADHCVPNWNDTSTWDECACETSAQDVIATGNIVALASALEQLETVLKTLEAVEWADNSGDEYTSQCPWCHERSGGDWEDGAHRGDCQRQTILRVSGRLPPAPEVKDVHKDA